MRQLLLILAAGMALICSPALAQTYQIGPGDSLAVQVFEEPDLDRTVRVAADGSVMLPLIGVVPVSNLSVKEAAAAITKLYAEDYLVSPQVSLKIQEFHSQRIEVLGAVKGPGVFFLTTGSTDLVNILAQAGGLLDGAGRFVLITQTNSENAEVPQRVDLHALLDQGNTELNVVVHGGDQVFIPKRNEIYVMGEVNKQGAILFDSGMSLLQAVSKAGGFSNTAALSRVQVIRVVDGKEEILRVDVKRIQAGAGRDVPLLPDDVITVPKSIF